jgi:hypothetical protein
MSARIRRKQEEPSQFMLNMASSKRSQLVHTYGPAPGARPSIRESTSVNASTRSRAFGPINATATAGQCGLGTLREVHPSTIS